MNFTLRILGTASAMPVVGKYQSAHVLEVHGRSFLIDCGEGVQQQMIRYGIPIMKLDSIFISHIHGDHLFGLFPLLSTMGMLSRSVPLNIFAPSNFAPVLKFFLSYWGTGLGFEIRFTPLSMKSPEVILSTKSTEVLAFPLNHGIDTFGFLFREKVPPMYVWKDAVEKYGLSLTEIGTLKRGEDVVREDGSVIRLSDAAYRPYSPRSYAYVSDTAPFPELSSWVKGVDILYHEATYVGEYEDKAVARHHSTTFQAATVAREAGAGKLIVGHYSSRCRDLSLFEAECKSIFPDTHAASDGEVFDVPMKDKVERAGR